MTRRKDMAHPVPQTLAEATELLQDYVALDRRILAARLRAEQEIDRIKAERDREIGQYQEAQGSWFPALKAWWEAGGKELAGRSRSAELAGAKIGIRLTPPKVKLKRGVKVEDVIAWLRSVEWSRAPQLLRTKVELDKAAIIKSVADSQGEEDLLAEQGVTVVQDDEFFIDTALDEDAVKKEVATA
ncbi:MAG: host-nuclease inhibitor Gam family protein [Novosphingobium sp.]|nr:host-nuclease inhibitor Gam family protein [Novosphingobium sp.]